MLNNIKEKILKFKILQLEKTKNKKYSEIFSWFIEYFKKYFEKQALIYIASLDNLNILQKQDFDFETLKKLLEEIYFLGLNDEKINLEEHLKSYWYIAPEIILDNSFVLDFAKNRAWELIKQIDETSKKEMQILIWESLKNKLTINEIAQKIKEKFDKYSLYRASLIAQQETAMAYSQATRKQNDIFTKKLWITGWKRAVTQKDSNVRKSHLINETEGWIPKNQVFSWTGDDNAPFWFFCRCRVDYSLVNPETGFLYDDEVKEPKDEDRIAVFEDRLKELANKAKVDLSEAKIWKNKYINLLNKLSILNANIPWKRNWKSSKIKKEIYNVKYNIILFTAQSMITWRLKGKYWTWIDTLKKWNKIWSVSFMFWKLIKSYHISFEVKEKIDLTKNNKTI